MQKTNWKNGCWRVAAPFKLVGAAVLFCLPWSSVECRSTDQNGNKGSNLVMTQSGLQAAYGGCTYAVQNPFRQLSPPNPADPTPGHPDSCPRAPLMIVYGVALVAGIVAGLFLRLGRFRRALVGLAATAAAAALLQQAHSGFPFASLVVQENAELAKQFDDQDNYPMTRGPGVLVTNRTPWFYGAIALPLAALAVVVLESLCKRDLRTSILLFGCVAAVVVLGLRLRPLHEPAIENGENHGVAADRAANPNPAGQVQHETSLGSVLIYCPPGSFVMGSPATEKHRMANENQVKVTISKGFYLGKFCVTQREFKAVMGTSPWEGRDMAKQGEDYPATWVDWNTAAEFCRKLTLRESQAGRLPRGYVYALPTEAQWEYACRAGTTTAYSFGNDSAELEKYGWWYGSPLEEDGQAGLHPRRVGLKKPNPWGFYDMHGNVAEWCLDAFADKLPGGTDPLTATGTGRVVRGGSWNDIARHCRSAYRESRDPSNLNYFLVETPGFRLALVPISQPAPSAAKAAESRAALDVPVEKQWKTSLGSMLIECPSGSFTMGRAVAEKGRGWDEDQVPVKISKGFYLGKYPVTRAEYKAVMGQAPINTYGVTEGDDCPVTNVGYGTYSARATANEFCRKLTVREAQAGRLPQGYEYALPTEAQWEYACRAGTTTAYWFGDDAKDLEEYAWCGGRQINGDPRSQRVHPVGQKKPNPWGLYDMRGNVWEMCRDVYTQQLPGGTDPCVTGADRSMVWRGCTWIDIGASPYRSAQRGSFGLGFPDDRLGFRLALVPTSPSDHTTVPKSAGSQGLPNDPPAKEWKATIGTTLIYCPPGRYTMGSPGDYDGYGEAQVTISKRYFLGRSCVTQGEFKAVMGTSPWKDKDDVQEGDDYPATYVDWNDAAEFCRKLTARESKAGRLPKDYAYALPTEAQWEYACRAGTITAYSFGRDAKVLADYAWYSGDIPIANSQPELHAQRVGQKKPNPWGFCDMHGNVWEWCRDAYGDKIPGGTDPFVQTGQNRAARGGSWFGSDLSCRTTERHANVPSCRSSEQGFRLALIPLGK